MSQLIRNHDSLKNILINILSEMALIAMEYLQPSVVGKRGDPKFFSLGNCGSYSRSENTIVFTVMKSSWLSNLKRSGRVPGVHVVF
jgi:hypothetical protein